jgi:pimeloyl-ACP methyl ester carboxylesterase
MDYVLVHGTTQSPRGWLRLTTHLESRGHRVAAVDLPTDRPGLGASEYAAIVREQVQGTVTAPVVVAHSGSGALLPAVADALDARHMVWLAAFIPDLHGGRSLAAMIREAGQAMFSEEWLSLSIPPTADPVLAAYFLFHDCDLPTLRWALSTVRLFYPAAVYEEPPDNRALPTSSTYVLPLRDRTLRPDWMHATAREHLSVTPVEIDAGHCPHVSHPDAVADILEQPSGSNGQLH